MYFSRLKDLREDADLTQKEVANLLHCQRGVYQRYESGESEIPAWALIKLANYYGTTTDYLLGLKNKK